MFSSRILQGAICLSWKTQLWHFCMKTLPPWEAADCQPSLLLAAALTRQPPWTTIPSRQQCPQELGTACSKPFPLLSRAKQFPKAVGHREPSRVATAQKLFGKGLWPKRAAHTGSLDSPSTDYSGQHKTWLQPLFPHPQHIPEIPHPAIYFYLSLSYEFDFRCLRIAFWVLVSPLDFPCHALFGLIFKPDHYFLFSLCFNTQILDNQTWDWLCATSVLSQAKFHSICGTRGRERDFDRHLLFPSFPSLPWQIAASRKHPVSQWIPLAPVIQSCVICSCRRALPSSFPLCATLQMAWRYLASLTRFPSSQQCGA